MIITHANILRSEWTNLSKFFIENNKVYYDFFTEQSIENVILCGIGFKTHYNEIKMSKINVEEEVGWPDEKLNKMQWNDGMMMLKMMVN